MNSLVSWLCDNRLNYAGMHVEKVISNMQQCEEWSDCMEHLRRRLLEAKTAKKAMTDAISFATIEEKKLGGEEAKWTRWQTLIKEFSYTLQHLQKVAVSQRVLDEFSILPNGKTEGTLDCECCDGDVSSGEDSCADDEFFFKSFNLDCGLINEDILEAFFQQGMTNELLESWARQEHSLWREMEKSLPSRVQHMSLYFMQSLAKELKLRPEAWYEMSTLFDLFWRRTSRQIVPDSCPEVCGSIFRLVLKLDSPMTQVDEWILSEVQKFSQWILSNNFNVSPLVEIKLATLDAVEMELLTSLEWRLNVPTAFTWAKSFTARFSVLTNQMFQKFLGLMWQRMVLQMDFAIQSLPPKIAPRNLAIGVFALGLVSANLIPANIVLPNDMDEARVYFLSNQPEGAASLASVTDGRYRALCELLETTTCSPLSSIQKSCHKVLTMLSDHQHAQNSMESSIVRQKI